MRETRTMLKKNLRNMKGKEKGFTLIELAIVLVVIGLLMGMAFKGKALVDASRVKAEVNKISKISTALNAYLAKYDTLPGQLANGQIESNKAMFDALIKEGLKESDFKSVGAGGQGGGAFWTFTGCQDVSGVNGKVWSAVLATTQTNLCIYRSSASPKNNNNMPGQNIVDNMMDGATLCQIETLLDDKNVYAGDARATTDPITNGAGDGTLDLTNWDCADTAKHPGSQWWFVYKVH